MFRKLFTFGIAVFVAFLASVSLAHAQTSPLRYGSGVYTNLMGSGTNANFHTGQYCNPVTGSCAASGAQVVKYTCDGRRTECRDNESAFSTTQNLAETPCGQTVQLDVFKKQCRVNNDWTCTESDLLDYMVWYSGECQTPPQQQTCEDLKPVNLQLRVSGKKEWVSGTQLGQLKPNDRIDANCFAKNGGSLLPNAQIKVTLPNGKSSVVASSAQLRNYRLGAGTGTYQLSCTSRTLAECSSQESVVVAQVSQPTPSPSPLPTPTPKPSPTPHTSSCDALTVVGGNNSLVPAKVTFRTKATDNLGAIQRYKYYFGDGTQLETKDLEVQHTYEVSGRFTARVDVKDSKGNWKNSLACEAQVTVKPATVESHKADCSDVFINADNNGQAPTTVTFDINGYDNKGDLLAYKIEPGEGNPIESSSDKIQHRYEKAGTYTIKAYVKDSQSNWHGGSNGCQRTLYVTTKPLTTQPSTGTPTVIPVIGIVSGSGAAALWLAKHKLLGLKR